MPNAVVARVQIIKAELAMLSVRGRSVTEGLQEHTQSLATPVKSPMANNTSFFSDCYAVKDNAQNH